MDSRIKSGNDGGVVEAPREVKKVRRQLNAARRSACHNFSAKI
jgi:hypothetical protein